MAGRYTVLLLRVGFLYELERTANDVSRIHRTIKRRWCYPAMHSKRMVAFVIVTEESPKRLMDRVGPTLEAISAIENYWCHYIFDDIVAKNGNMDPLTCYVREAWQEVRKRNSTDYVREPERAEPVIIGNMEGFNRRAAIEMGIKARRPWK
jgi:hypothetical protein